MPHRPSHGGGCSRIFYEDSLEFKLVVILLELIVAYWNRSLDLAWRSFRPKSASTNARLEGSFNIAMTWDFSCALFWFEVEPFLLQSGDDVGICRLLVDVLVHLQLKAGSEELIFILLVESRRKRQTPTT